jgi:hypothetical protein
MLPVYRHAALAMGGARPSAVLLPPRFHRSARAGARTQPDGSSAPSRCKRTTYRPSTSGAGDLVGDDYLNGGADERSAVALGASTGMPVSTQVGITLR